MDSFYQDIDAIKYLDFLNSKNGQIQQAVLWEAFKKHLPQTAGAVILDAACGGGWLSGRLKKYYKNLAACDSSEFLINFAKTNFSGINFKVADIEKPLPYRPGVFDAVILNMAAPDLTNLEAAMKNLSIVLKHGGKLFMTVPNPPLTYPAAVWKRGILGFLLGQKPKLKIKKSPLSGPVKREFGDNIFINSHYYKLADYILAAQKSGLEVKLEEAVKPLHDSNEFDLNYQLFRYPLLLLLVLEKTSQ